MLTVANLLPKNKAKGFPINEENPTIVILLPLYLFTSFSKLISNNLIILLTVGETISSLPIKNLPKLAGCIPSISLNSSI